MSSYSRVYSSISSVDLNCPGRHGVPKQQLREYARAVAADRLQLAAGQPRLGKARRRTRHLSLRPVACETPLAPRRTRPPVLNYVYYYLYHVIYRYIYR